MASRPNPNREWTLDAACRDPDADPEWFKPRQAHSAHQHPAVRQALRYCQVCPVTAECDAEAASALYPMPGVWGGRYYSMPEAERRHQQQKRSTAARPES